MYRFTIFFLEMMDLSFLLHFILLKEKLKWFLMIVHSDLLFLVNYLVENKIYINFYLNNNKFLIVFKKIIFLI
jgi:hypothetical protein